MQINYVTLHDLTAGAAYGVQIMQMCRAFTRLGHTVKLYSADGRDVPSPTRMERIKELYGDEIPFPMRFFPRRMVLGRLEMLGGLPGAIRAMKGTQSELIYCRGSWEVYSLARIGPPIIFEAHATQLHAEFGVIDKILRSRTVRASHLPNLRLFVPISKALAQVWQNLGVPAEKIHVAHDAVNLSLFEPMLTIEEARSRLGLHDHRPVVLYAGSLYADRGLELLLDAAKGLPDLSFWILGGSESDIARSKKAANSAGVTNVIFLGFVQHSAVPLYLFAADVLLMLWTWKVPTIATCSPLKLFEYMAARRTIVGPAFPTVVEVLEDGVDAILFEPDNLSEMIQAIQRGVEESRRGKMAEAARRKAETQYTWEQRCAGILAAFESRS